MNLVEDEVSCILQLCQQHNCKGLISGFMKIKEKTVVNCDLNLVFGKRGSGQNDVVSDLDFLR